MKMHSMCDVHPESKNQSRVAAVQVTCVPPVKVSHPCIKQNVYCIVWFQIFFLFTIVVQNRYENKQSHTLRNAVGITIFKCLKCSFGGNSQADY
jgi:hypothetical protein